MKWVKLAGCFVLGFLALCIIAAVVVPSDKVVTKTVAGPTVTQTVIATQTVSVPGPTVTAPAPVESSASQSCPVALDAAQAFATSSDALQKAYGDQAAIVAQVKVAVSSGDQVELTKAQNALRDADAELSKSRRDYNAAKAIFEQNKDACK